MRICYFSKNSNKLRNQETREPRGLHVAHLCSCMFIETSTKTMKYSVFIMAKTQVILAQIILCAFSPYT